MQKQMELRVPRIEGLLVARCTLAWYWKLENFAAYEHEMGKFISSPPFHNGDHKFRLLVYPRGINDAFRNNVNVCLQRISPPFVTQDDAEYQLSVSHTGMKQPLSSKSKYPALPGKATDLPRLSIDRLILLALLTSTQGHLTIKCEIFGSNAVRLGPPKPRGILGLENFLNNEKYSDVKIIVGDKTIHAHKLILTNGNEVFAAMFEHSMIENEHCLVEIDDITHDVMLEVLRYIYSGKVVGIEKMARDLLIAADKYGIQDLKVMCEQHLISFTTITNVLENFCFADKYNADTLRELSKQFIKARRKEILGTPTLENMVESMPPRLVVEIMRSFA